MVTQSAEAPGRDQFAAMGASVNRARLARLLAQPGGPSSNSLGQLGGPAARVVGVCQNLCQGSRRSPGQVFRACDPYCHGGTGSPVHESDSEAEPVQDNPSAVVEAAARGDPRRRGRLDAKIRLESRSESKDLVRLADAVVWVNKAHPAYRRAQASRGRHKVGTHVHTGLEAVDCYRFCYRFSGRDKDWPQTATVSATVSPGTSGHARVWKRAPMLGKCSQPGKLTGTAAPAAPTLEQNALS